jgi:hypothetical protein
MLARRVLPSKTAAKPKGAAMARSSRKFKPIAEMAKVARMPSKIGGR